MLGQPITDFFPREEHLAGQGRNPLADDRLRRNQQTNSLFQVSLLVVQVLFFEDELRMMPGVPCMSGQGEYARQIGAAIQIQFDQRVSLAWNRLFAIQSWPRTVWTLIVSSAGSSTKAWVR